MIRKSALKETVEDTLRDHEVDDTALATDLLDNLVAAFGEEVYDDEDEDEG